MQIIPTDISEVLIIEPQVYEDARGYFSESYNNTWFCENVKRTLFVQDNESFSTKNTFRGMHYQIPPFCQSKLVRVTQGEVMDFVTDLRLDSKTFGKTIQVRLSAKNHRQLWIPRGFAHGFLVLSDTAVFQYKVDNTYSREHERSFSALDPHFSYDLPSGVCLSEKDKNALPFLQAWFFKSSLGLYDV